MSQIEKTKLIDQINQPASDFTTAGNASLPPYVEVKDTKLESILQINPKEISAANERLQNISSEIEFRRKQNNQPDFSIAPEEDAAYLDAVKKGDDDTVSRIIKETVKRANDYR